MTSHRASELKGVRDQGIFEKVGMQRFSVNFSNRLGQFLNN